MAKINENSLRNWNNGETMTEADYEQERSIIVTAHNDTDTRVDNLDTGSNNHKTAPVLDHPNGSVTRDKIANGAVNLSKVDTADFDTRYYTESEIDGKIATINTRNTADENALSSHKTSGDHDGRYYTETEVDTKLSSKADVSSVYTKTQLDGGQLDSRYFTESEVNSLLESNRTGNHAGTWQGLTPEGLGSESINGSRITAIEQKLSSASVLPVTLKRGWNYFSANEPSPLNVTVQGRTLVNLLGKDGNAGAATISKYQQANGIKAAETSDYYVGTDCVSVTGNGTATGHGAALDLSVDNSKYYLFSARVKIPAGQSCSARIYPTNSWLTALVTGPGISGDGTWKYLYTKISPTQLGSETTPRWAVLASDTSKTAKYLYDAFNIYEIDSATYAKIDVDPEYTGDKLAEKYPYVDSIKPLSGVYLTKPGKNLLPPFTDSSWTINLNAALNDPYNLTLNATGAYQGSGVTISVVNGQTYTINCVTNSPSSRLFIYKTGVTDISNVVATVHATSGPKQFTVDSSYNGLIRVVVTNDVAGTFTFTNPQLELGSVATSFEVRNDDYLYVPTTLSGMNGVYDIIDFRTGRVLRRWKDVVLDGSLAWMFDADGTGFKSMKLPLTGFVANSQFLEKYDGKILPIWTGGSFTSSDFGKLSASGFLYISILDTDSGWGESYTPTADDIKAYFYGWRMCADGGVGTLYNGTGTKAWHRIQPDGTVESASAVTIAPTTQGISGVNYKLTYQLATAVDEPVADLEGSISLHAGGNQVEYGEGVIVREKVTPVQAVVSPYAFDINNTASSTTKFKNATNKILRVYKNDVIDNKWVIRQNRVDGYGGANAYILPGDYDPTAKYTVTYIALDKYSMTTNVIDAASEYQGNIEMVLRDTVKKQADIVEAVSILQSSKSSLVGSVNEISNKLSSASVLPVTVKRGWNYITANESAPLNVIIQGRTLVNLLGKDGNCEDASKWADDFFATHSLDSANKVYGSNSIKIAVGTGGSAGAIHPFSQPLFVPGKYYVAIADVKNGNATSIMLELSNGSASSSDYTDTTKFGPVFMAFPYTTAQPRVTVVGSEYEYGYVDGYRIYEITQAEYNELDTMSVDKIAKKYPYVDSVKHLSGAYLSKPGKNLLPPFTAWTLHANAVVTEPYKLTLNATADGQTSYFEIQVIPNTDYTLSMTKSTSAVMAIFNTSASVAIVNYTSNDSLTFNSGSYTAIRVYVRNSNGTTGTFTFSFPQLELGSVATAFEPYNADYMYIPTTLAGINGVYDTFDSKTGRVLRRFKEIIPDGSYECFFGTDFTGFKRVAFKDNNSNKLTQTIGSAYLTKYDGKIIKQVLDSSDNAADQFFIAQDSIRNIYITVADTDSGWGESYTPTSDEVKAFFNGWRMKNEGGTNTSTYSGTGTKVWVEMPKVLTNPNDTDGVYASNGLPPQGLASWNNMTHVPYKLTYQLASAIDEPVAIEGSISLNVGGNQVEYGEGMIVREPIIPLLAAGKYQIGGFNANLKRKVKSIVQVFRNGVPDNQWSHYVPGDGYGNLDAVDILVGNYDSTAEYTVTYTVLDSYAITTNVTEAAAEYQGNIEMVLRETVKKQADLAEAVSILQATKANRGQGQWIAPTLLNGWVNLDSLSQTGYMKNEIGIVELRGVLKNGNVTNILFILPKGYRPKSNLRFSTSAHNGTTFILARIIIGIDGSVTIYEGANIELLLDGIQFRAEQ